MSYVKDGWHSWDYCYQNTFIDCMKLSLTELDPGGEWEQWTLYQKWLPVTRIQYPEPSKPLTRAEAYELAIALHAYLEDLFVPF